MVTRDERAFLWRQSRMSLGRAVEPGPDEDPQESERARQNERDLPANGDGKKCDRRREHDPDVGGGVEYSSCEGALALWEPLGHGLDAAGKVRGFTQSDRQPPAAQTDPGPNQAIPHRSE